MGSPAEPGLMSQSIEDLFSMCDAKKDHEFLCRMSYIEIYNEEVRAATPAPAGRDVLQTTHTYYYIYYTYTIHILHVCCCTYALLKRNHPTLVGLCAARMWPCALV
jgi:hypothetical protein